MTKEQERIEGELERFFGGALTVRVDGDLYTGAIELYHTGTGYSISLSDDMNCQVINLSHLARTLAP